MENLINALFPTKCLFCHKSDGIFCKKCLERCWIIEKDFCLVCDRFSVDGKTHRKCSGNYTPTAVFSCYSYTGIVRQCLKLSKFGSKQFYVLKILINDGIAHTRACGKQYKDFIVVPIPISKERFKTRGFNQAEIIAKAISKAFKLKICSSILIRQKSTEYQFTKNRQERYESLKDVFNVTRSLQDKRVLLVDDLTTTGATLLEASRALYLAGAKDVHCFTLCKRERKE